MMAFIVPMPGMSMQAMPCASRSSPYPAAFAVSSWANFAVAARACAREVATMKRELLPPEALARLVQRFLTDYYLKNETNADQANVLARAEVFAGDYRAADRFMEDLKRVTPEDIRRVARQYLKDFRFAYVGDASKLDRSLLTQF